MTISTEANQDKYPFKLPALPFEAKEFEPNFSNETFEFHHQKHHATYVNKLNDLLADNMEMTDHNLEDLIVASNNSNPGIFNNAAQVWNHSFFWHSISPQGGDEPEGEIAKQIAADFGDYANFANQFKEAAITQFGSGWAWLVYKDGKLSIMKTANADTPLVHGVHPIIACDVWEHAYYIDYRNNRAAYVDVFLSSMLNWQFAEKNLLAARGE